MKYLLRLFTALFIIPILVLAIILSMMFENKDEHKQIADY